MDEEYEGADRQSQGVWPLYVGLFLVLLSFFIMLAGASESHHPKGSGVVDSLQSTFRPQAGWPQSDNTQIPERATPVDELASELAGFLRAARVERANPGEELRVTMPTSELFFANSAELHEESIRLIDRVVTALCAPPHGGRLDIAFSLGRPDGNGGDISEELALAVRRGGAFVRALVDRGAPPTTVAIGIDANLGGRAALVFRYVAAETLALGSAR